MLEDSIFDFRDVILWLTTYNYHYINMTFLPFTIIFLYICLRTTFLLYICQRTKFLLYTVCISEIWPTLAHSRANHNQQNLLNFCFGVKKHLDFHHKKIKKNMDVFDCFFPLLKKKLIFQKIFLKNLTRVYLKPHKIYKSNQKSMKFLSDIVKVSNYNIFKIQVILLIFQGIMKFLARKIFFLRIFQKL